VDFTKLARSLTIGFTNLDLYTSRERTSEPDIETVWKYTTGMTRDQI
jgi:hypothetical protein